MSIFQSIGRTASNIYQGVKRIALTPVKLPSFLIPRNIFRNAVVASALPIGLAGKGISAIGSGITRGVKGATGFLIKESKSPVIVQGVRKGLGTIGSRIGRYGVGGILGGLGASAGYLAISGKPITPQNILRSGLAGIGFGLSKAGGTIGVIGGTGENIINALKTGGQKTPTGKINLPDLNIPPHIDVGGLKIPERADFSGFMPSLNISTPTGMPTMVNTPAFSPSVSVGGGGMDYTPLILALLGGGALAGYAIGRRRKKKRFKKKKKHK